MFRVNEVLILDGKKYRILSLFSDEVVWISLDSESDFPSLVCRKQLVEALNNESLSRGEDPFVELAYLSPEEGSTARVKRDINYQLIIPIISDPLFFNPKVRSKLIYSVIEQRGSTKQTLYRLIRRYWQRGQTPNALIPDYKNSGGKGKKRQARGKKLGRPRQYTPGTGAIIDDEIERIFRIAIDRYLLTDKGYSFPYAHRRFKALYENHYPEVPESEIPSNWQMLYFYRCEYPQVERIQKRTSKLAYNKDVKPLTSTATSQALGPGSRYEIDATIADIYLVSDSNRRNIVGRPVVYFVIDVFSRMVAGFYIGFENPSYVAAMQALAMAMVDKTQYCLNHGVEISEEEWPTVGLPDAILADRGELLGHQIEALESNFSVRLENTPPYRGDAKGIVERNFRTIQATFKPFAPGVVTETRTKKRGGKDYRLDAKLTVTEFKEIILSSVLVRNQYDCLKKYDRGIDMPPDLPMTPLSIWNWGLQNRTGRLRPAAEDALRVSLLPREKVTLSDLGACMFGIYFTSPELISRGWLHRSKEATRPASMVAAYDPASADNIYVFPHKNSVEYWICNLAERSREFKGCSFWDVWQVQDMQKRTMANNKLLADKKKRDHETFVEKKIENAISRAPADPGMTKAERLLGIRENRDKAKQEERRESAYRPESQRRNEPASVIPITKQEDNDYSYPDHLDELFDDED